MSAPELARALRELAAGQSYKASFEALLLELPLDEAERWMLACKEGRGAWTLLLAGAPGQALFVGNPRSGTPIALARSGYQLTQLGGGRDEVELARQRLRTLCRAELAQLVPDAHGCLAVPDNAFALVVVEDFEHATLAPGELARVCADELVWVGDNRLAYKLSRGRRGEFRVPTPWQWLRALLRPAPGARSLWGHRRLLARRDFGPPRGFALYPHRRDFALIAGLRGAPTLPLGPKERANRWKLGASRLGLFPVLTPSYLFVASRRTETRPDRGERLLAHVADELEQPAPALEHLVATRGNTAVLLTASAHEPGQESVGRWCLHAPLSPQQETQARAHYARLVELRERFPRLPVPAPLWEGRFEGQYVCCEARLAGLSAPQLSGEHGALARLYGELARALSSLVVERVVVDEQVFEELIGAKLALVTRYAQVTSTIQALARAVAEARERLLGLELPRVLYHADLRPKHVQASVDGRLLGLLDWGSSEDSDLPGFDLLHMIVHERKQEADSTAGAAWRWVRDGLSLEDRRSSRVPLRDFEREALSIYARALELEPIVLPTIAALYPVLVGAMAEKNWDYSRPRWIARNFEL